MIKTSDEDCRIDLFGADIDASELQAHLERFSRTHGDGQRKWQPEMESKIEQQFRELRNLRLLTSSDRPGNDDQENQRCAVTCFNYGRVVNISMNCPRDRRTRSRPDEAAKNYRAAKPLSVAFNHTTRQRTPNLRYTFKPPQTQGNFLALKCNAIILNFEEVSLVP